MTSPVLRRATPDDAEALAQLGRRTFVETFVEGFAIPYPPDDLAAFLESSWSAEAVAAQLADPGGAWWVSENEGTLVAFARCGGCGLPHPDARASHAELKGLYVDAAHQGRGIGRALFEIALGWMEAQGDGPLWLGVWSGNLKAQRFYRYYGFEKVGEYEYPVGSWRDLEHILRRDHAHARS